MRVRVVHEFISQEAYELSIFVNEELDIINQNVGSGWWQAVNSSGKEGLIPSTYVEVIDKSLSKYEPSTTNINNSDQGNNDEWDDEWDSDESDITNQNTATRSSSKNIDIAYTISNTSESILVSIIRRNFSRSLIKSGIEDYLLDHDSPPKTSEAVIEYVDKSFRWLEPPTSLSCEITSFKKDSKMKGIKSFIAYQLKTSLRTEVSRRYKHFDWLHIRLVAKYPCIFIPPLPEKALTGRYEEDFVGERCKWLQQWLTRMCRHPVISKSPVFHHFLTCKDMKKWKAGKREAETDRLQGGRFYFAVESNDNPTHEDYTMEKAETFERFLIDLERSTRVFHDSVSECQKRINLAHRKEFSSLSSAFIGISRALQSDVHTKHLNQSLASALQTAGDVYKSVAELQTLKSESCLVFQNCLKEFSGILSNSLHVTSLVKSSCSVVDELNKFNTDERLSQSDVLNIHAGAFVITRSVQAECNYTMDLIRNEWASKIKDYLKEQANTFQQISIEFNNIANLF